MPDIDTTALKIGTLAARTGTTAPTIRFYEEIGLLPRAGRGGGGQRRYGADDVRRLNFVRHCREFGFSVKQVRRLVGLVQDEQRDCREARDIGHEHLDAVRAQLADLRALERQLVDFVRRCDRECVGGPGPTCVPLAQLGNADRDGKPSSRARARRRS